MGWITPLGHDLDQVWRRLLAGETAIGPVSRFDASTFVTNFAAEVRNFDLARFLPDTHERHSTAGVSSKFALAAAASAWRQAGLDKSGINPRRVGVYLGAGEGSLDFANFAAANIAGYRPGQESGGVQGDGGAWARTAFARMSAPREIEQEPNLAISHLAAEFGCRGPSFNCMTACAAGAQSVGEAFEIIRRGDADVMLAGGADSRIDPLSLVAYTLLGALSTSGRPPERVSRPFDRGRDGFVLGEGAGVLVLESEEHAKKRGATIYAECVGYGSSFDAFAVTQPEPEGRGAVLSMREALRDARVSTDDVDYISAHGTSTVLNDLTETVAVKKLFGARAAKVPMSSIKSMIGHLIGAAGALEAVVSVLAIRDGILPPTINLDAPDPQCDLDYVPNRAREAKVRTVLSNSFGFGGQNASLVIREYAG